MSVKRQGRVLVVVANLTTHGRKTLKWVYRCVDAGAMGVPNLVLWARYRSIVELTGPNATVDSFVDTLDRLARDPRTQAIDVLISLHGTQRGLWFAERWVATAQLGDRIAERNLEYKLRLLYSTACYGANHAPDFVRAGFCIASGAIGVNANGAHDYPAQLIAWGLGLPYRRALDWGNRRALTRLFDRLARQVDFEDVNSLKLAVGKGNTRISSSAS